MIKVHACGICFTDIWTARGAAGDLFPITPGHEVVGEVVEVGEGVHTRKVGDRVGTTWVQSTCGQCTYCRQNLPLSGQAAYNCPEARLTGFTT
ncbi:MAG: alcohol dehydrogenase catalytic domain-containing protein [Trebonia sp.]